MKKEYQSRKAPVQDEVHLGPVAVQATTAFPTNSASWRNRQDAIEAIKINCFRSFGKCKLTIVNTEVREVVDYVKAKLEKNDSKTNFSEEEKNELLSLIEMKRFK